jgi:hypothetical protein
LVGTILVQQFSLLRHAFFGLHNWPFKVRIIAIFSAKLAIILERMGTEWKCIG